MNERIDLAARISQATGIHPEKVCDVVQLALEELHRIMIVDEKGPTAAVMEACFSFGGEAAFHLIGLFASEHDYHGRDDDAGIWSEVAMRFIPNAYAEGYARIAPWFREKTAARLRLDADKKNNSSFMLEDDERDPADEARLPTHSEMDAMVNSAHERGMREALEILEKRTLQAAADHSRTGSDRRRIPRPMFLNTSPERYAEEHKRFLKENNPKVLAELRKSGDLNSYLSSVGEQASDRFSTLMMQYQNSPEVRNLPFLELVQALQSRRHEANEIVLHDIIYQPLPEA